MATIPQPQCVWELSIVNELLTGAYLDFGLKNSSPYLGSREVRPGVVVDFGKGNVPIGIEFYDSTAISLEVINELLDRFGLRRFSEAEYADVGLATARGSASGQSRTPENGGPDAPGERGPRFPGKDTLFPRKGSR